MYVPAKRLLSPEASLAIARKIALGFEKMGREPRVQLLKTRIQEYNQLLNSFGLTDHQVKQLTPHPYRAFQRLMKQLGLFIVCFMLCLPGLLLFSPIFAVTKYISQRKAREALAGSLVKLSGKDVIATWKLLTALVIVPLLFLVYTVRFFIYYFLTK